MAWSFFNLTSPKPRSYPFRAQWIIPKSHMSLCHNMDFQVDPRHGKMNPRPPHLSLPVEDSGPPSTPSPRPERLNGSLQFAGQRDKNLMEIGPKALRLYQNMMVWLWHINLIGVNSSVDWKLQSFFKWGLRNVRRHPHEASLKLAPWHHQEPSVYCTCVRCLGILGGQLVAGMASFQYEGDV